MIERYEVFTRIYWSDVRRGVWFVFAFACLPFAIIGRFLKDENPTSVQK
jgi:hypothetical protein